MPELKNNTILILSPQSWGTMFISKHHYALELAKRGNKVYFLNPPDRENIKPKESIEILTSKHHPNLFLVDHRLFFPYILKFKVSSVFHWLMQFHVRKLIRAIPNTIDIVWSFDLGNLYPLRFFGKSAYKIFHPVDEPLNAQSIQAAKGADIIFSVTHEILEKYIAFSAPKHFINHGVQEYFIAEAKPYQIGQPIRIGFSANMLRRDIDRDILIQIVEENRECVFEFLGSYQTAQANIGGGEDSDTKKFIERLLAKKNVVMHGAIPTTDLAVAIKEMDAFLICYDVQKDQSKGTNYHKVMEYLATGRVVISSNITTYRERPDLVQMVAERNNNFLLPWLFKNVIINIMDFNHVTLQNKRISFSLDNTYAKQIHKISDLITSNMEGRV